MVTSEGGRCLQAYAYGDMDVYEITHPPLGKTLMSIPIKMFGMSPFFYRLAGFLAGVLMIPFIYLISLKMFKNREFAIFSAILLMFDFLHFSQTRIATIDSFVTLFILIMYYFMYMYYEKSFYFESNKKLLSYLCLSGVFFGLAMSVKWTGIYGGVGLCIVFFMTLYKRYQEYLYEQKMEGVRISDNFINNFKSTILFCILFFVLIPIIIYWLSYFMYLQTPNTNGLSSILENQKYMLSYHNDLYTNHPYASDFWTWTLVVRPVYYYANTFDNGLVSGISGFGNPIIWYMGTISFFYTFTRLKTENRNVSLFLLIGYLANIIPWVFVFRTTYMYHYFPASIFMILMISNMFLQIFKTIRNKYVILYIIVVIAFFILYYPVIAGVPVSEDFIRFLRLLPSWVLGPVN